MLGFSAQVSYKAHLQQHRGIQKGFSGEAASWKKKSNLGSQCFLEGHILFTPGRNPCVALGPVVHAGVTDS